MPPQGAGLQRRHRLCKGDQFKKVFADRLSVQGRFFGLHGCTNHAAHPRLGLAVSKKVSKRAVVRNGLKRLIRESFRHRQHKLAALDIVVVCKPASAQTHRTTLRRELDQLWFYLVRKIRAHRN